jgi:hypothetical protein
MKKILLSAAVCCALLLQYSPTRAALIEPYSSYAGDGGGNSLNSPLQYPNVNLPDHGGRLGVDTDGPYSWHGIKVIKVTGVYPGSGLYGTITSGDYIYGINGFNLRDANDLSAIVNSGAPGSTSTVWYLDSKNNYTPMKVTINAVSAAVFSQTNANQQNLNQDNQPFCSEHPFVCAALIVGGTYVVAKALSGSGSQPSESSSQDSNSNCHMEYPVMSDRDTGQPVPGGPAYQVCN